MCEIGWTGRDCQLRDCPVTKIFLKYQLSPQHPVAPISKCLNENLVSFLLNCQKGTVNNPIFAWVCFFWPLPIVKHQKYSNWLTNAGDTKAGKAGRQTFVRVGTTVYVLWGNICPRIFVGTFVCVQCMLEYLSRHSE